jgi:TrmH family RNA methyltransferase
MTFINSAANDNIKRWRKISEHPRGAKKIGSTLAEGIHLAEVICQKRPLTRAVVVRENNVQSDVLALAERVAEATGAKLLTVTDKLYDAVCPVENGTGIMVEVAATFADRPVQPIAEDALYLDGVQDAGNMGTLIRTALAAGVRHIAASSGSAGFWAPKVLRAGMGAHFSAKLYDNVSAEEIHTLFAGRVLAADARGGMDLFRTPGWEKGPVVWMMGAEGPGLSLKALAVADERYLIPIEEACESLNVGAAAAVCLFEQRRRRLLTGA